MFFFLGTEMSYNHLSVEELIELLKGKDKEITELNNTIHGKDEQIENLETELDLYKGGYLYLIQFKNDEDNHIFKLGKTGLLNNNFEIRMNGYRTTEQKQFGEFKILEVVRVTDNRRAEKFMHNFARECGLKSPADRSNKKGDKSEWYIDPTDGQIVTDALRKAWVEYLNIDYDYDNIIDKYNPDTVQCLKDDLVEITHYKDIELLRDTYFIHKTNHVVYKRSKYGLDVYKLPNGGTYTLNKRNGGSASKVKPEYLIETYCE